MQVVLKTKQILEPQHLFQTQQPYVAVKLDKTNTFLTANNELN